MNRFIGLIIMVVAIAALAGAAIGWRFPFLGSNRSATQISTSQEGTQGQPARLRQASRSRQQTVAQDTNVNVDTDTNVNTGSGQSGSNKPVPALW
ncbi:MAG TPA: hypothetical protein DCE56_33660 [Cyanobacteria bacterium UBA8553]|nr:hypothetical protein [Cyanobacteria bacterium UBA8553]